MRAPTRPTARLSQGRWQERSAGVVPRSPRGLPAAALHGAPDRCCFVRLPSKGKGYGCAFKWAGLPCKSAWEGWACCVVALLGATAALKAG
eukprot:357242-Chlamydomonas_euryale.AAC.6